MLTTVLRAFLTRFTRHLPVAFVVGLIVLGAIGAAPPATSAATDTAGQSAPITAQDVPVSLVASGVNDFTLVQPTAQNKLIWHTAAYCPPIIQKAGKTAAAPIGPAAASDPEVLTTGSTFGGFVRQIFYSNVSRTSGTCNPYHFRSNLVADASYVYWVDDTGLERLSVDANVGDAPQLAYNFVAGGWDPTTQNFYLGEDASNVYVLAYGADQGGPYETVGYVAKTTAANPAQNYNVLYFTGTSASNISSDGTYLYWLNNGTLWRHTLGSANSAIQLATNVTAYHAEGSLFLGCFRFTCFYTSNVFIAQGTTISVYDNDNSGAGLQSIYTTTDPVYALTSDDINLYFFESHAFPCAQPCLFTTYNDVLYRGPRSSSGSQSPLYTYAAGTSPYASGPLVTDNTYLYWAQNSGINRLPNNAAALPVINLRATGLEVTQGVQRLDNSVLLIQNRRTFVRMYVQSDGAAVPDVTANLYGSTDGCASTALGPLVPVNPAGTTLTVQSSPNRNDINQSFLFELPWSWTTTSNLSLCGVMNPYQIPLEPNYADDQVNAGPFTFQPSPRFQVQFVAYGYVLNNTTYYPRFIKDILQTYSWLRRVYPLASQPGFFDTPGPGLRTNLWFIGDDQLASRVNQTDPSCSNNLCASGYVINQLGALRAENGASANTVYYGMISDAAGFFPRGQDDTKNAAGPAGSGTFGWDNDGSYADWYAGHEIGHANGRAHPSASAKTCGNSASDNNYPYTGGQIGPSDSSPGGSTLEGFDVGDPDPSINLPMAVYPGASWFDMMSYCSNIWISDYTYTGMYNYMTANPPSPARLTTQAVTGDLLSAFGVIYPDVPSATFNHLRRLSSVASVPTRTPGAYSIRLINGSGSTLADYPFTPFELNATSPPVLGFGQVVSYVAGTAAVEIIRLSDGAVLTKVAVGATPPTVSGVALQGAPNPVSGTVTLAWKASAPGGTAMTFDVLYSRDGGTTFQPLQSNVSGTSVAIDTSRLGGGTGIFRVIATAGVQTGQADSPSYTIANKPPQPQIITPGNGAHFHYGQIVNLSGAADDFQDGGVADSGLSWSSDKSGALGTGGLLTVSNLPVGTNVITLTAKDSAGLSAQVSVTIVVDDNLSAAGPTLSVGPTQIGWHVADGVTTKQTAQLTVANTGSGTLTWTATTNAPWISLDTSSGTAPSTINVTGDPTSLASGAAESGTVTITGSDGTTIVVPVGMAKGNVWTNANEPVYTPAHVFLPAVANSATGGW